VVWTEESVILAALERMGLT